MTTDNPRNPMCPTCFYSSDCSECYIIAQGNKSLYDMQSVDDYVLNRLLAYLFESKDDEKEEIDFVSEVDELLKGEEDGKKKTDKGRNRRNVRGRPKKDKKKTNVRGKRTRRGKAKKDMAKYGEEKTSQENNKG